MAKPPLNSVIKQLVQCLKNINEPVSVDHLVSYSTMSITNPSAFKNKLEALLGIATRLGLIEEYNSHYFAKSHPDDILPVLREYGRGHSKTRSKNVHLDDRPAGAVAPDGINELLQAAESLESVEPEAVHGSAIEVSVKSKASLSGSVQASVSGSVQVLNDAESSQGSITSSFSNEDDMYSTSDTEMESEAEEKKSQVKK